MENWLAAIMSLLIHPRNCIASTFGMDDGMSGFTAACTGRRIGEHEVGIAHRTLPCGSHVILRNPRTGKIAAATVIDRGPYGARDEFGRWVLKTNRSEPGVWRGCIDLTHELSRLLEHNGFERVIYAPVSRSSSKR